MFSPAFSYEEIWWKGSGKADVLFGKIRGVFANIVK